MGLAAQRTAAPPRSVVSVEPDQVGATTAIESLLEEHLANPMLRAVRLDDDDALLESNPFFGDDDDAYPFGGRSEAEDYFRSRYSDDEQ